MDRGSTKEGGSPPTWYTTSELDDMECCRREWLALQRRLGIRWTICDRDYHAVIEEIATRILHAPYLPPTATPLRCAMPTAPPKAPTPPNPAEGASLGVVVATPEKKKEGEDAAVLLPSPPPGESGSPRRVSHSETLPAPLESIVSLPLRAVPTSLVQGGRSAATATAVGRPMVPAVMEDEENVRVSPMLRVAATTLGLHGACRLLEAIVWLASGEARDERSRAYQQPLNALAVAGGSAGGGVGVIGSTLPVIYNHHFHSSESANLLSAPGVSGGGIRHFSTSSTAATNARSGASTSATTSPIGSATRRAMVQCPPSRGSDRVPSPGIPHAPSSLERPHSFGDHSYNNTLLASMNAQSNLSGVSLTTGSSVYSRETSSLPEIRQTQQPPHPLPPPPFSQSRSTWSSFSRDHLHPDSCSTAGASASFTRSANGTSAGGAGTSAGQAVPVLPADVGTAAPPPPPPPQGPSSSYSMPVPPAPPSATSRANPVNSGSYSRRGYAFGNSTTSTTTNNNAAATGNNNTATAATSTTATVTTTTTAANACGGNDQSCTSGSAFVNATRRGGGAGGGGGTEHAVPVPGLSSAAVGAANGNTSTAALPTVSFPQPRDALRAVGNCSTSSATNASGPSVTGLTTVGSGDVSPSTTLGDEQTGRFNGVEPRTVVEALCSLAAHLHLTEEDMVDVLAAFIDAVVEVQDRLWDEGVVGASGQLSVSTALAGGGGSGAANASGGVAATSASGGVESRAALSVNGRSCKSVVLPFMQRFILPTFRETLHVLALTSSPNAVAAAATAAAGVSMTGSNAGGGGAGGGGGGGLVRGMLPPVGPLSPCLDENLSLSSGPRSTTASTAGPDGLPAAVLANSPNKRGSSMLFSTGTVPSAPMPHTTALARQFFRERCPIMESVQRICGSSGWNEDAITKSAFVLHYTEPVSSLLGFRSPSRAGVTGTATRVSRSTATATTTNGVMPTAAAETMEGTRQGAPHPGGSSAPSGKWSLLNRIVTLRGYYLYIYEAVASTAAMLSAENNTAALPFSDGNTPAALIDLAWVCASMPVTIVSGPNDTELVLLNPSRRVRSSRHTSPSVNSTPSAPTAAALVPTVPRRSCTENVTVYRVRHRDGDFALLTIHDAATTSGSAGPGGSGNGLSAQDQSLPPRIIDASVLLGNSGGPALNGGVSSSSTTTTATPLMTTAAPVAGSDLAPSPPPSAPAPQGKQPTANGVAVDAASDAGDADAAAGRHTSAASSASAAGPVRRVSSTSGSSNASTSTSSNGRRGPHGQHHPRHHHEYTVVSGNEAITVTVYPLRLLCGGVLHNFLFQNSGVRDQWYQQLTCLLTVSQSPEHLQKIAAAPQHVPSFLANRISYPTGPSAFDCVDMIGAGSFGRVLLVQHKLTGKLFAMKVINKTLFRGTRDVINVRREQSVLEALDFPFIVKIHATFQTDCRVYLLLDYVAGGDLLSHTKSAPDRHFDEATSRFFLAELAIAVEHLRVRGIIHRDIKGDNVVLDNEGHIVVTDFGFAKKITVEEENEGGGPKERRVLRQFTRCGTLAYIAPEMLHSSSHNPGYGLEADWWSVGVVFFTILTGYFPFLKETEKLTSHCIVHGQIYLPPTQVVSEEVPDLLAQLLHKNPAHRISTLAQLKAHRFFAGFDWEACEQRRMPPPQLLHTDRYRAPAATPSAVRKLKEHVQQALILQEQLMLQRDYADGAMRSDGVAAVPRMSAVAVAGELPTPSASAPSAVLGVVERSPVATSSPPARRSRFARELAEERELLQLIEAAYGPDSIPFPTAPGADVFADVFRRQECCGSDRDEEDTEPMYIPSVAPIVIPPPPPQQQQQQPRPLLGSPLAKTTWSRHGTASSTPVVAIVGVGMDGTDGSTSGRLFAPVGYVAAGQVPSSVASRLSTMESSTTAMEEEDETGDGVGLVVYDDFDEAAYTSMDDIRPTDARLCSESGFVMYRPA